MTVLDLDDLGLDEGAAMLLARAVREAPVGGEITVRGRHPDLALHLRAWCRAQGHALVVAGDALVVTVGSAVRDRWHGATRAGEADVTSPDALAVRAPARWGLAARGALVEAGGPAFDFALDARDAVWSDDAPRLYAQAAAAQWDPATIDWTAPLTHDDALEDAVVQVMTYLIENETAALIVPARFAARVHPHYREVMQLLAIQAADEARHIEVFTRRATLRRTHPGTSTAGGQSSLKTLVDEADFDEASFLLSVLGEGSFLSLLWFLHEHGPDAVTREVARRAAQDEARHVAFGLSHLAHHAAVDPSLRARLAAAITRRHDALRHTAGLNDDVFDALVHIAGGALTPAAVRAGHARVQALVQHMDDGRRARLQRLGYDAETAAALSSLHTRNFM